MKTTIIFFFFFTSLCHAQTPVCENVFIITTDGFRWQEIFRGADPELVKDERFVSDSIQLNLMYGGKNVEERRSRLMPFTWNYLNSQGQLWGNRDAGNEVSITNPYNLSYPGYNEILTGYADPSIIQNKPRKNQNQNLLFYLNSLPEFHNKVAMYGSWDLFRYILNAENKSWINCGFDKQAGDSLSFVESGINFIQDNTAKLPVRSDILTYTLAAEYINRNHPRVMYISFGETDEFAHSKKYDQYLHQANLFDSFLKMIWNLIQNDPVYKGKTVMMVTTDHGRSSKDQKWFRHGAFTRGSDETWLFQIGPGIDILGEVKIKASVYAEEIAQTIAGYLGLKFEADHDISPASLVLRARNSN